MFTNTRQVVNSSSKDTAKASSQMLQVSIENFLTWTFLVQIVRRGSNGFRDVRFRVRREKVLLFLRYLKENNKYYSDVLIDENKISQLPIDGQFPVKVVEEDESDIKIKNKKTNRKYKKSKKRKRKTRKI